MKKKFRFRQLTAMLLSAMLAFSPAASAAMPVFAEETENSAGESETEESSDSYEDSSDDADDNSNDKVDTSDESSDDSDESDEGDESPEDSGSDEEDGASEEEASGEEDASDDGDGSCEEDAADDGAEEDDNDAEGTDDDLTDAGDGQDDEQVSEDTSDEDESEAADSGQSEDTEDDTQAESRDAEQAGTAAEDEDGTEAVTEDAEEEETSETEEEVSSVISISVDTVSVEVGTVSTTAAAASVSAETSFDMDEEVYYSADGTVVTLTVNNPDSETEYSEIEISYSMGKNSGTLEEGTDFEVELESDGDDELIYIITILADSEYNSIGQSLIVTSAGEAAGSFEIVSSATVSIVDNVIIVEGEGGETAADYIDCVSEICIVYTDADGEEQSVTYITVTRQGNNNPEYTNSDLFDSETGAINLDCGAFAMGSEWEYTITLTASGFDDVTAVVGETSDDDTTAKSAGTVTMPEDLEDGVYSGTGMVEPDDDDGFNFYYITVAVTVSDGAVESFTVSGAEGSSNAQYSERAETGINEQLKGITAGSYEVDAVSTATCSSIAIVEAINAAFENEASYTTYGLGDAIYDPEGTSVELYIYEPEDDVDYSDIAISYALGKFAAELTIDEDFTTELIYDDEDTIVYLITLDPEAYFTVDDDTASGDTLYNSLGMALDVTVNGSSAGRFTIEAGFTASIVDNTIVLDGDTVTVEEYISGIHEVVLEYTDEDGEAVSETYTTQLAHDVYPDYYGSDIFNEDGSVNFDCAIFVYGSEWTYTITVSSNGFDDVTAEIGAVTEEEEETVTEGTAGSIVIPEGIEDGVYTGEATVEPDEDEDFDAYTITVYVTVEDGAVTEIEVEGATGSNATYTTRAANGRTKGGVYYPGVSEVIVGQSAGTYGVDAVSGATCSTNAIVEAINAALASAVSDTDDDDEEDESGETSYEFSEAVYNSEGTTFTLTVSNPVSGTDYSDVALTHADHSEVTTLTVDEDYKVEIEITDDEVVYTFTIISSSYNSSGTSFEVLIAGESAGSVEIVADVEISLENNAIVISDESVVSLEDYLGAITGVTITYTGDDGEEVTNTYSTTSNRYTDQDCEATDIFSSEDGSVIFTFEAFVNGEDGTYTITITAQGYADVTGEVGNETEEEETSTGSAGTVTMPEGLEDGVYSGTGMVEPDDDDGFNFYYITVAVTVSDGAVEGFTVSGADGNNTQYSYRAETGINEQLVGITAGSYDVDVVSMATCSSYAIVEAINDAFTNEASYTTYELGDAIYDPDGTAVTLTIYNPEDDVDYSDISLSYAVGKFASELTEDTDFTVELVSRDEDEIVYLITILSGAGSTIEDDTEDISVEYNSLGMNLDVAVAGTTVGRITIDSGATAAIVDNTIVVEGNDNVSVEDYIEGIGEVTLTYTDEDGNEVSVTYTTKLAHDVYPEYYAEDIFNEDGSINFDCAIFVYGSSWTYTITIEANGFEDLTAEIGGVTGEEDDDDDDTDDTDTGDTDAEEESETPVATPTDYVSDDVTDGDDASDGSEGVTGGDDETGDTDTDDADTEEEAGDDNAEASDTEEDTTTSTNTAAKKSSGSSGTSSSSGSNSISTGTIYADGTTAGIVGSDGSVTAGVWQSTAGGWKFSYDNGSRSVADSWVELTWNGVTSWYRFDMDGYMVCGWYTDPEGNTFFLHDKADGTQGYMYTGWKEIDGRMYYFEETRGATEGRLYRSTITPDGSVVDETGAKVQ